MTYAKLKLLVKVLLTGDNMLTSDNDEVLVALETAFMEVAEGCTPLKLLTLNPNNEIIRNGPSNYYVRKPELPDEDTDDLDIDTELVPVLARLIASYVSKDKGQLHYKFANKLMVAYENKVRAHFEDAADSEANDVK